MPSTSAPESIVKAKSLIRRSKFGALATLSTGPADPYCSHVNIATLPDGAPILLISRLALHTKNILGDPRVSLLVSEHGAGDPLEGTRVSLSGPASEITDVSELDTARRRYLARHPSAQTFVNFKDFSFFKVVPTSAHLIAGFGRIVSLAGTELMTPVGDADEVMSGEASAVEHMNEDHSDANQLYAKLLGGREGDWQMTGLDPEGADLALDGTTLRLTFPERVTTGLQLRKTLVAFVSDARARV